MISVGGLRVRLLLNKNVDDYVLESTCAPPQKKQTMYKQRQKMVEVEH